MILDDKIREQVRKYNGDRHPTQCVGGEFLSWILAKPEDEKLKLYRFGVKRANKRRRLERYIETMD
jgi:hypothetical protein